MYVPVVLNSRHTVEMVVDSGANLISLPEALASRLGIKVSESAPTIMLELADGSRISARRTQIGSVRVGQFTVENVS